MTKNISKGLWLIAFLMLFQFSFAQTSDYPDKVHLKNGSILICKILDYQLDAKIKVTISGGTVLVYNSSDVLKIERGVSFSKRISKRESKDFHHLEDGHFIHLDMDFIGGYKETFWGWNSQVVPTIGLGLRLAGGKVINRHLMIGGGVGWTFIDNQFMYSSHVPVFAELRGDINKNPTKLFYSVAGGYNQALKSAAVSWNGTQMTAARGGYYFSPGLGLSFASTSRSHLTIDVRYAVYSAGFDFIGPNGEMKTSNQFNRTSISVGIQF